MARKPPSKRKPRLTGVHRNVVLRPHQDERLNRLIEESGVVANRNQLVRLIADKATPADLRQFARRP